MLGELRGVDPRSVGSYELLGRLGCGGMGQVYLGRSARGRLVAVKVVRPELAAEPGFRMRFAREVSAARNVSGLFTALVVDADVSGPEPWLATVYVAGPSLAEAVADQGPLPVSSVLALAAGLAEGLKAIHAAGVVHRDLKPANVLLADDGPRVIDFGISRPVETAEATALTQCGTILGSPGFMSPEQAEGREAGPPSDVFSLGAVLAFAATGAGPFGTGSIAELIYRVVHGLPDLSRLPAQVRPLVEPCLAKDPRQRPSTGDLMAALGAGRLTADWLPAQLTAAVRRYPQAGPGAATGPVAGPSLPPGVSIPRPRLEPDARRPALVPRQPAALDDLLAAPQPGDAAERRQRSNRRHLTWATAAAAAVLAAASAAAALTMNSAGAPHRDAIGSPPGSIVAAPPSRGRAGLASPRVSPTPKPTTFAQAHQAASRNSPATTRAHSRSTITGSARGPRTPVRSTPVRTPRTPVPTPTPTPTPTSPTPTPSTPTPTPSTGTPTSSPPTSSPPTSSTPTSSTPTSSTPTSSDPTSSDPTSSDPTSSDPTSSDPTSGTPTAPPSHNHSTAVLSIPAGRSPRQSAGDDHPGRGRAGARRHRL
jgi:hypothetical protein